MTECTNENIHLFIKYMRGELHRKEERQVDSHVQSCQDCYFNFAYVEEIFRNRQKLSIDEKTLLFKYISDPIWQYEQNKLKQQIKQEILTELKLLNNIAISAGVSKNDNANSTNKIDKVNNSEINSSNARKQSKESNDTNASLIRQNSQLAHRGYSIFIAVAFTIIFLSLSTSIYLIVKNQNLSLFTSSTISSSRVSPSPITTPSITIANNTNSINYTRNTFVDNNLYQQLDSAIDRYLESKGSYHLKQAQDIANDIERKYGDKYGVDLVAYYQSVPFLVLEKLLIYRKKLAELTNQASGDDYRQRLETSQNLEKSFFSLGNLIEAYKTKALVNKLHVQLHNDKDAKSLTQQGLDFSTRNKYLFLEADFLLWQAKYLSEIPDFINAEERFLKVVELGNKLNINKLVTSAGTALAFLYYNQEDNEKAFELTKKILINFTDYKNTQAITLLQLAGLTSFNLYYYEIANSYLKEAIRNSEEINNPVFISRSYTFLALTFSQQKNFNQADNFYSKAELEINNIRDETARLESLAWILGYKAKLRLLENKYNEAIELYQNKLSIMDKIHLVNNLEFSQSHEGIAIALSAVGQQEKAQKYSTIAKNYQRIADTNNQRINCLLALVPTNCDLKEQ